MDLRPLTPKYLVSPQISAEHIPAIAEAGIETLICNRPDSEIPAELQSDVIRAAAEEAGLNFVVNQITNQTMTPDRVARQRAAIEAARGPVLAYCRSGTRSTVIWALGAVRDTDVDEIVAAARAAGYELTGLRPALEHLALTGG